MMVAVGLALLHIRLVVLAFVKIKDVVMSMTMLIMSVGHLKSTFYYKITFVPQLTAYQLIQLEYKDVLNVSVSDIPYSQTEPAEYLIVNKNQLEEIPVLFATQDLFHNIRLHQLNLFVYLVIALKAQLT